MFAYFLQVTLSKYNLPLTTATLFSTNSVTIEKMLTISFNVSYGNVSKKVSCSKTQTGIQLVQLALEKFKIEGKQGELTHNGKKLDSSLPIRLSNLLNNAKLALTVREGNEDKVVNIKLAVNANNDTKSYIMKLNNTLTLGEILEKFAEANGGTVTGKGQFELAILNSNIRSDSAEILSSLKSIVGNDVSSLVIRMSYLHANDNAREQEMINERQMQGMRDYQRQEKIRRETEQAKQTQTQETAKLAQTQETVQVPEPEEPQTSVPVSVPVSVQAKRQLNTNSSHHEAGNDSQRDKEILHPPEPSSPAQNTLYMPSSYTTYENPDTDYEMTVDQALKYHKMIVNSTKKKPTPRPKSQPKKYSIRLKFPDQVMLQLELPDPTVKLGQLLKQIDTYLLPPFQSNYNLKTGYPPFAKLPLSLTANSTALVHLPLFQDEKMVLIWEPMAPHPPGPYILQDALAQHHIKQINDLPEVRLESTRASLPAAEPTKNTGSSLPPRDHLPSLSSRPKNSDKMPKWFKLSR